MSELKVYVPQDGPYGLEPEEGGKLVEEETCYLKSDVDAVIAELKQKLEDAGVRERRLNNALDKERSETIKYMDELCNAKNEIERLTIDKRNDELRADVADGTVEKLKAENVKLKRALWLARANRAIEKIALFKLWNASISTMNPEDGARQEYDKWKRALGKFLKKAEECK